MTKDEADKVQKGEKENALVYLLWDIVDNDSYAEEKDAIDAVAGDAGYEVGIFLDVSLYKAIGDDSPQKITNVGGTTVTISVSIPDSLINKEPSKKRTYYIIYEHEGKVRTILPDYSRADETLTFETSEFSVYSIAYEDVENGNEGGSGNGSGNGNSSGNGSDNGNTSDTEIAGDSGITSDNGIIDDSGSADDSTSTGEGGKRSDSGNRNDSTSAGKGDNASDSENGNAGGSISEDESESGSTSTEEQRDTLQAETIESISKEKQEQLKDALEELQKMVPNLQPGPYIEIMKGNEFNVNNMGELDEGIIAGEDGRVRFTIDIPHEIAKEGRTYYLVTVDEDGNITVLQNESIVDGLLTFTGDPNATYQIIYEDGGTTLTSVLNEEGHLVDENGKPVTVDMNHCFWHYLVFILSLMGVVLIFLNKDKKKVATALFTVSASAPS